MLVSLASGAAAGLIAGAVQVARAASSASRSCPGGLVIPRLTGLKLASAELRMQAGIWNGSAELGGTTMVETTRNALDQIVFRQSPKAGSCAKSSYTYFHLWMWQLKPTTAGLAFSIQVLDSHGSPSSACDWSSSGCGLVLRITYSVPANGLEYVLDAEYKYPGQPAHLWSGGTTGEGAGYDTALMRLGPHTVTVPLDLSPGGGEGLPDCYIGPGLIKLGARVDIVGDLTRRHSLVVTLPQQVPFAITNMGGYTNGSCP
jgi:hypothetical protein